MYSCIHACVRVYAYKCLDTVCGQMYKNTYMHKYEHIHTYMHTCMHITSSSVMKTPLAWRLLQIVHIHTCTQSYTYIHTYMHTCIHTYIHVYHLFIRNIDTSCLKIAPNLIEIKESRPMYVCMYVCMYIWQESKSKIFKLVCVFVYVCIYTYGKEAIKI
jgi:hypothetical protein